MPRNPIKIDFQDTIKEGNRSFFNLLDPLLWKRLVEQAKEQHLQDASFQVFSSSEPLAELLDELLEKR